MLRKLITEYWQRKKDIRTRNNSSLLNNNNFWDGFTYNLINSDFNSINCDRLDHRGRVAMLSEDRKELILSLWNNQIKEFITNGGKSDWSYKKIKGKFLKNINRNKDNSQAVNQDSNFWVEASNNERRGNTVEVVRNQYNY